MGGADWLSFLSDSIKKIRRSKGLSQETLGERAGMSGSKISNIEIEKTEPTAGQIAKIARALEEPELMLARCRTCEIRMEGFKEFFPQVDLGAFIEISDAVGELNRRQEAIADQFSIVSNMRFETDEFAKQFSILQKMFRDLSYTAAVTSQMADMAVFIKR